MKDRVLITFMNIKENFISIHFKWEGVFEGAYVSVFKISLIRIRHRSFITCINTLKNVITFYYLRLCNLSSPMVFLTIIGQYLNVKFPNK